MNKVIALVGMCGSGKSVANDFFKSKGYTSVYFGGATMDELQKRGLEVNPANEKMVREELRKTYGPAAFAILNLPKIEAGLVGGAGALTGAAAGVVGGGSGAAGGGGATGVIVDGLYSWSEYKILKDKFGESLVVVAIYSPPALRYARLAARPVRPISLEDARARDYAEIENIEKGGPIAMADYTLVNNGDMDNFMAQLNALAF